jgi:hypothetical protein
MPSAVIKAYARESGKTVEQAEACWEKAKKKADAGLFKDKPKNGAYWGYVNNETRRCLNLPVSSSKPAAKKAAAKKK